MSNRKRFPILALLAAALIAVSCSNSANEPSARLKPAVERRSAPDFTLKDENGKTVHLSDYRGKVVLLNFWATWCDPCRIEIPWFVDFERRMKGQGFAVVGVSMDEDGWKAVKPFLSELSVNYRVLLGDDSVSQMYGGIDSLPTTFIIDRDGKIAATHIGLVSKSRYENDLKQLFEAEPRSAAVGRPGHGAN